MTDTATIAAMNQNEQTEWVALARSLTPDEWAAPSLCTGLSVRDVVVHIAAHIHREPRSARIAAAYVLTGFAVARTERRLDRWQRRRHAARSTDEIVDWLAEPISSPDSPTQLSELVIHQQDVRRAISRPRVIAADRLRAVLDFSASKDGNRSVNFANNRIGGLRLVATDLDWTLGDGPEVTGPGEAILVAINGRNQALSDLSGPGLPTLIRRTVKWSSKFASA